jgi:CHAT domain-containing protein/tetratricopeptide (TPR) repeat protein
MPCNAGDSARSAPFRPRRRMGWLWLALLLTTPPALAGAGILVRAATSQVLDAAPALQVGDRLLGWRALAPGQGSVQPLDSALQWRLLVEGVLPLTPVQVEVERVGQRFWLELRDGTLVLEVEDSAPPDTPDSRIGALLAAREGDPTEFDREYERVWSLSGSQDGDAVAVLALIGASQASAGGRHALCRERLARVPSALDERPIGLRLGEVRVFCAGQVDAWRETLPLLRETVQRAGREAPGSLLHARLVANLAQIDSFTEPHAALAQLAPAMEQARAACGECRDYGLMLSWYGDVLMQLNRLEDAAEAYAESARLGRGLDGSGAVAMRQLRAARPLRRLGRLDQAEALLLDALQRMQEAGMREAERAPVYNTLGTVAAERGRLREAADWFGRALRHAEVEGDAANARHNLAWTLAHSGDLDGAEREYRIAAEQLARFERGVQYAVFLSSLAEIEIERGADEQAAPLLEQVREIQRQANPEAVVLARTEAMLAALYARQGRDADAAAAWERALAIHARTAPDSLPWAELLLARGLSELASGRAQQALPPLREAARVLGREAPDSIQLARVLQASGEAALALDDAAGAREALVAALAIRARDLPGTAAEAESLHALGRVHEIEGDATDARERYCGASERLDHASLRVGGGALGGSRFRARFAEIYRDCVRASAGQGDASAALESLERGRARGFRFALEQRRLRLQNARADASLLALVDNLDAESAALSRSAGDAQDDLERLRTAREALAPQLGAAFPGGAALDLAALRARLAPDEVYIAYSIGQRGSLALLLTREDAVQAVPLAIDAGRLRGLVAEFRRSIALRADESELRERAAQLHRLLVRPWWALRGGRDRLLLSPDASLHDLPFAALWDEGAQSYLIEAASLRLLDALSARPAQSVAALEGERPWLALGDPALDAPQLSLEVGRRLLRNGAAQSELPALAGARREVEAVARYAPGSARVLVGNEARESALRRHVGEAGLVHLAAHALLDLQRPLDSALVLGADGDGGHDGLLHAHEVFESLRLSSELVVLSACNTASGRELAGEGLLSLSRAFRFAGARATVASLWPVTDEATARLMDGFYRQLARSADPAIALRAATRAWLTQPDAASPSDPERAIGATVQRGAGSALRHPYYWAAFQVYGD